RRATRSVVRSRATSAAAPATRKSSTRSRRTRARRTGVADAVAIEPGLRVVGRPVVRHDARDKVMAATAYAADWAMPGMLHAFVPGAPLVHEAGNLLAQWRVARGDLAAGFARAAVIVEGEYRTHLVDSAYLEPESGVAWIDADGVITIRLSTQVIEHFRDVAE